jgi:putative ABC transport system permease protein
MVYVTIARNLMPYMPPAILVVGVEPGHEKAFLGGFQVDAGRSTLQNPSEVILGRSAADYYRKKDQAKPIAVGDSLDIQNHSFVVVGILKPAPQLFNNAVIMPLETAQSVFDRPGGVSSVILTAASVADLPKLKADISARYPDLTVSTQEDLQQSANVLLDGMNKFFALIINSIVVVAIVIVTIVVVVAVMEQRKDIGTLRAVGAGRWSIFGMVAGQSLVLSLFGALLALPIAVFLTRWGMSEIGGISGILSVWGQTILVAMIVGLLASILPAWQALRVDPLEALRYE